MEIRLEVILGSEILEFCVWVWVRGLWRGREGKREGKVEVREERESLGFGDLELGFQREGRWRAKVTAY